MKIYIFIYYYYIHYFYIHYYYIHYLIKNNQEYIYLYKKIYIYVYIFLGFLNIEDLSFSMILFFNL